MTYFTYNYLEKKVLAVGLKEPVKVDINKEYCLPELPPLYGTSFVQWLTLINTAIVHRKEDKVSALCELFPKFYEAWSSFIMDHIDALKEEQVKSTVKK